RNRVDLIRSEWAANGCLARARVMLAEALHEEAANGTGSEPFVWSRVDSVLSGSIDTPCRITARAIGSRLDINNADEALISRLFVRVGFGPSAADSAAAAIRDWIDADDVTRTGGAEAAWYRSQSRRPPRNAPLADLREAADIRGLEQRPLDDYFDVETGPI